MEVENLSGKRNEQRQTHGKSNNPLYKTWDNMNQRCNNPNHTRYKDYGGRGIKVCERWSKFENFYEDVSKLEHFGEEGYTLDRINNDGDYEPSNVRWASSNEQNRNRRDNVFVEYQGKEMTLADAADLIGINYRTLYQRYHAGKRGDELFGKVGEPMSGTRGRPVGWRKENPLQRPHRSLKAFDNEWLLIKKFMLLVRKDPDKAEKLINELEDV